MRAGVDQAIAMLASGAFSRRRIREEALQLARTFRATLNAELQHKLDRHCVPLNAESYFAQAFVHKMGL